MTYKVEMGQVLSRMTVEQRLEMHAHEAQNLCSLLYPEIQSRGLRSWNQETFEDIENREYERAISKATGNYEPPDGPGWEGGFADNH